MSRSTWNAAAQERVAAARAALPIEERRARDLERQRRRRARLREERLQLELLEDPRTAAELFALADVELQELRLLAELEGGPGGEDELLARLLEELAPRRA